jgi:MarR family transcriptional regulator for hemolysin
MRPTTGPPIGLRLTKSARVVSQAFERAMSGAGGSASMWQVLLLVRSGEYAAQSQMAEAMGITAATLTHHLASFEKAGLVRRWRDTDNRRVQRVELTDEGLEKFAALRDVALAHAGRLNAVLDEQEQAQLADYLDRMAAAVGDGTAAPATD